MTSNTIPTDVLLALIEQVQDAAFIVEDEKFTFVNHRLVELLGYSSDELLHHNIYDFLHEDDREMVKARHAERLSGNHVISEYQFKIVTKRGSVRNVNLRVGLITNHNNKKASVCSLHDITETQETKQALAHSLADIQSILKNMPDVFYRTDMNGIITMVSPSCQAELGFTPEEMIGRPLTDFYCNPKDREKVLEALIEGNGNARQVEARIKHKNGSTVWISTNAYIRLNRSMQPICVEGIARNITERKIMEQNLDRLVKYDDLTNLYNRRNFMKESEYQVAIAQRYKRPLTAMMLDMDRFKSINDRLGHQGGDTALIYFADACRHIFRKTDIIGRIGGEEFAVLMPETECFQAEEVAERLREYLKESPSIINGERETLTFSAGLSSLHPDNDNLEDLLNRADRLLYQAKREGRDRTISRAR